MEPLLELQTVVRDQVKHAAMCNGSAGEGEKSHQKDLACASSIDAPAVGAMSKKSPKFFSSDDRWQHQ